MTQDINQGSTGGNKKATVHSRSPRWIFEPESIHFLQGICVKFGAMTRGFQTLQAQAHLSIRDMLKYFSTTTPEKLSWPLAQYCRSSMAHWSISSCQAMNSLNWHLTCIQEQFLLSLIQIGFWRGVCWRGLHWPPIKVKPILLDTTFHRKERKSTSL